MQVPGGIQRPVGVQEQAELPGWPLIGHLQLPKESTLNSSTLDTAFGSGLAEDGWVFIWVSWREGDLGEKSAIPSL